MSEYSLDPASTSHVSSTVVGVVAGGLATGAVVLAAPLVLPALGLAAVGTSVVAVVAAVPWIGAAVGGWFGYNHAVAKAHKYGIRRS